MVRRCMELITNFIGYDRYGPQGRHADRHWKYVVHENVPTLPCSNFHVSVTYLFRTTGQVLGVSLSGALLQAVLTDKLQEKIKGPDAAEVNSIDRRVKILLTIGTTSFKDYLHDKVLGSIFL